MKFLLSAEEVKAHLKDFVILDARFRLNDGQAGARLFAEGHIPGAAHVSMDKDLSGPKTGKNGRHPLPSREALVRLFSRLGIGADTPVLAYDDTDHSGAGRLWLLLRYMGHENVFVLNGGWKAWTAQALPVETGAGSPRSALQFPERAPLVNLFERQELEGQELWDARAPERYRGEVEPLDPQAGHIPGARNLFYQKLLGPDGRFLNADELTKILPSGSPTFYCGSGVTATVPLLAAQALGRNAAIYPGSWSEWCTQEGAPVAKGDA